MRLIDADNLLNEIDLIGDGKTSVDIKGLVEKQKTVDPVAHARWKETDIKDDNGNILYECSHCGAGDEHFPGVNVPYCWKCGAKMDLG